MIRVANCVVNAYFVTLLLMVDDRDIASEVHVISIDAIYLLLLFKCYRIHVFSLSHKVYALDLVLGFIEFVNILWLKTNLPYRMTA